MQGVVVAHEDALTVADSAQDPFVVPVARCLFILEGTAARRPDGLGVAQLARLDFLVRHPVLLARLLERRGHPLEPALHATQGERLLTEAAALGVRYGPWDDRYKLVLGRLIATRLCAPARRHESMFVLTDTGRQIAMSLRTHGWERTARHAQAAARHLPLDLAELTSTIHSLLGP